MKISIEYHGEDERKDLYVVRIVAEKEELTYNNLLVTLERSKHKISGGVEYTDVWYCDNYRLEATKRYFINEVIEALYGERILDDDWRSVD